MSDSTDKIVKIIDQPTVRRVEKVDPAAIQTERKTVQTVGLVKPVAKVVDHHEIHRVDSVSPAVVQTERAAVQTVTLDKTSLRQTDRAVVQTVGCDKTILKMSYRGPQGPKGDTATFNDLQIPSLAARFLGRLI